MLLASSVAYASSVNPAGIYSESQLIGARASVGNGPAAGSARASAPVAASATAPQETSIVAQAKSWVSAKLSSLWGDTPARAVRLQPSSVPVAAEPVVAPAPSITRQLSAPMPTGALVATSTPSGSARQDAQARRPASTEAKVDPVLVEDPPGLDRQANGVAVYDLSKASRIPRLHVGREASVHVSDYALDTHAQEIMNARIVHPFPSPDLLLNSEMKRLTTIATGVPLSSGASKIRDVVFLPKGKVSRETFDKIVLRLAPERPFDLTKFKELTREELRFLSGLLLFQQGDKCPVAVGLFHELSKAKGWEAEADYYLAMCSRKMGLNTDFYERSRRILETQDVYYSRKIMGELGSEIPYEMTESLGLALFKASSNAKIMDKLETKAFGDVAYLLADFGASTSRFKTALEWAKKVPAAHPRRMQARFIEALAEYQSGSKERALKLQEDLITDLGPDKDKAEFQALVALNAARMYFQERKFKPAHESFLKVYKDHPMWLQSLTELGWSQLMSGDFEGAIGNMYSIQSPFFAAVYKPESYVIRTIGYLNLCQYADAYKTLSIMEHDYRPQLEKIDKYIASKPSYYQTVRDFMNAPKKATEVDGLPLPIVREMARHRDFTNLQKALNRQADERVLYTKLDGEVAKGLKHAQGLVNSTRRRIAGLRQQLAKIAQTPALEGERGPLTARLDKELDDLNDYFFQVDLYNEAQAAWPDFRKDVIGGADLRLATMRSSMEKVLSTRLLMMKTDLARYIDNNELLRYEVFAGSGENIRFQVSGGTTANRVPSSVIPKSKSLQWDFDGEYWEDEIGHYRSGLKNNCAGANGSVQSTSQANLEGNE